MAERHYQIHTRYLSWAEPPFAKVEHILRRHRIAEHLAYSHKGVIIGAVLDEDQLAAVRGDRQVEYVDRDVVGGAARFFRHLDSEANLIKDRYSVVLDRGTSAAAFAARTGIVPTGLLADFSSSVGAVLTEQQIAELRRQPEVRYIEAQGWASPALAESVPRTRTSPPPRRHRPSGPSAAPSRGGLLRHRVDGQAQRDVFPGEPAADAPPAPALRPGRAVRPLAAHSTRAGRNGR
ncbi:hypothetical protein ABT095_14280 [Kitasatospora sp. NPDC002227]|uniref:hypothetical protein n=1 Tax=Kitasatospora sp. NPDC002227 TaxID=3154773 RepID=UPI003324C15F